MGHFTSEVGESVGVGVVEVEVGIDCGESAVIPQPTMTKPANARPIIC
jgi:hypothetical protein